MGKSIEEMFAGVGDTNYPGSTKKRRALQPADEPQQSDSDSWDAHPYVQDVAGKNVEFFFIGAIATALGRSPNTIRRWIENGTLPKEKYRTDSASVRGQHRLWTRVQVEGLMVIARQEGLYEGKNVGATRFAFRAKEFFRTLKAEGKL